MGSLFRFVYCRNCGIRFRRTPRKCSCGGKTFGYSDWYIRYFVFGHSREEKTGPSRELALRVLRLRENEVVEGRYRLTKDKKILMRDFLLGDYWERYAKLLKSAKDYRNRINQALLEFGDMWLHQIEQRDIEGWVAKMKEANKPGTVKRQLAFLSGVFTKAVDYKYILENPARAIKIKPIDNKRNDYLGVEDYRRLLEAAETHPILKAVIVMAVGTGMRAGELFSMKWSWCDFKRREIRIPADATKSNRSRTIPIIEQVCLALESMPRSLKSEYVLISPRLGKPYADHLKGALEKARVQAGLPDHYGWHIIGRHTFASWYIEQGGDIYCLQKILGHESIKTTERYAHLAPDRQHREINRINSLLLDSESVADIQRTKNNSEN